MIIVLNLVVVVHVFTIKLRITRVAQTLHSLCYDSACPVTSPPVVIGYIIQQGNGYYLYMFKLLIENVIYF